MNPLADILPPRWRRYAYGLLGLAALGLAAYKAADGDWLEFAGLLLGSLGFGAAGSNVEDLAPFDDDVWDDELAAARETYFGRNDVEYYVDDHTPVKGDR